MQCYRIKNNGTLQSVAKNTDGSCPSNAFVLMQQNDYALMVQAYEVTPEQVLSVFTWGFGVVMLFWSLGYAVGVAKQAISKL